MEKTNLRLFLGIALPATLSQSIQAFEQAYSPTLSWIPTENLHITVHFLGDTPVERLTNLGVLLETLVKKHSSFTLQTHSYTFAPKGKPPRMIWLQWQKTEAFKQLVWDIEYAFQQIEPYQGIRKSPIPHTTLIRLKGKENLPPEDLSSWEIQAEIQVQEIVLWESILLPKGAVYQELACFSLKEK